MLKRLALCTSTCLLMAAQAGANEFAEFPLIFGGTYIASDSTYSYLGIVHPDWGGELGRGWYQSAIVNYLTYEYTTAVDAVNTRVKAKAPGVDIGLGYIWSGTDYSLNLSGSVGYRNFDLSPDLPNEEPNGGEAAFTPQVIASYEINPAFKVDLISNFSIGPDSTYNRLRGGYVAHGWRLGPEFVYQDGENYRNSQIGIFTEIPLTGGFRIELSVGQLENQDDDNGGYISLGFSKVRWN